MPKPSDEQIQRYNFAIINAKKTLRRGDRIRASRCGGIRATYTFECWDGNWIVSRSGIDDISAINIDRVNGHSENFAGEHWK